MITIYFNTARKDKLKTVKEFRQGTWINVENATKEDITTITKLIDLDYDDLSDGLDQYESPRIERENNCLLLFLRHPTMDQNGLNTTTLTIVFTEKYIITVSPTKSPFINELIDKPLPAATTQSAKLLLLLLLKLSQSFTKEIRQSRKNHVIQQQKDIERVVNNDIVQLTINEHILNEYLSSLSPMKMIFEQLLGGKYIPFHEDDADLLEDLLNSIRQSYDMCVINLKSIRSLRDSYQIIFTNNLNRTMKTLTTITIILTIPTIIGSLFGMNVHLPLENHPFAFIIVIALSIISAGIIALIFRIKDWL
ncbi:hypothetical protein HGA91_06635 [candidate division WWE3 bacterium]|nr:hypothetical protein [candidate division WWE3 bacterium]